MFVINFSLGVVFGVTLTPPAGRPRVFLDIVFLASVFLVVGAVKYGLSDDMTGRWIACKEKKLYIFLWG